MDVTNLNNSSYKLLTHLCYFSVALIYFSSKKLEQKRFRTLDVCFKFNSNLGILVKQATAHSLCTQRFIIGIVIGHCHCNAG